MDVIKPPRDFNMEAKNLSNEWKTFKQEMDIYLVASEKDGKDDKIKTSLLLNCMGKKALEVYNTFNFDPAENNLVYAQVKEQFDAFFNPKKNMTFLRYNFFTIRQHEGEAFDQFVTRLKTSAKDCELGTLEEDLVKDMIVIGCSDRKLQEQLLRKTDLKLTDAVKAGHIAEETKKNLNRLKKSEDKEVDQIQKRAAYKSNNNKFGQNYSSSQSGSRNKFGQNYSSSQSGSRNKEEQTINNCSYCSYSHPKGKCPAFNKTCNRCGKKGHFKISSQCRSKKVYNFQEDEEDCSADSSTEEVFFIEAVTESNDEEAPSQQNDDEGVIQVQDVTKTDEWNVMLNTSGTEIEFKIDTGAQVNLIPKIKYNRLLQKPKLIKSSIKLHTYSGSTIPVVGKCICRITHNGLTTPVMFVVVDIDAVPILGLKTSAGLRLIQRIMTISATVPDYVLEFGDCFGELGKLSNKHHIVIDKNVTPVVHAPRKVPVALRDKLKKKLDQMESMGVIERVTEPTDWVSSLVTVEKPDGSLRLCLDPKDLNKAIKRQHYHMPTAEEIFSQMAGAKYFTKLDASNAYWQVPLDEESTNLMTFNTPFGRYKFLRLAFGIHSASEICQQEIGEIIEDDEGSANEQDDIIIWGRTKKELRQRSREVLKSVRKSGLKLNLKKCEFEVTEVTYLGHKISGDGIQVDPKKSEAVTKMDYPENKKGLQRFLGTVNYLGKFIPNLAEKTAVLRTLLKKDSLWSFDEPHKKAVDYLKMLITTSPVLKFFDDKKPVRVTCDASTKGLGCLLEQQDEEDWYPVAYGSRSLNQSEMNYVPIELETLAVVFACKHFHEYLYGRQFLVQTDHQPLKTILQKSIVKCPPRLQRFMLNLQRYDFKVEYIKGSQNVVSDMFSRSPLKNSQSEISADEINSQIHLVLSSLPISKAKFEEIAAETAKDETLQCLIKQIESGFPHSRQNVDPRIRSYQTYSSEMSVVDGIILKGDRIVIPKVMRKNILKVLHQGHQGIENVKQRARVSVFWPNINGQITDLVQRCELCQEYTNRQPTETLINHEVPEEPWAKVGTDLFSLNGKEYLIIVDYNTKYFDVCEIPDASARTAIEFTKRTFSKFGIPKEVVSDNGPCYDSQQYRLFSKEWDFKHTTSSPTYPRSNGMVERTIQTVKKTLRKCKRSGEDVHMALLALRSTPRKNQLYSPGELLMKRQMRTILPSIQKRDLKEAKLFQEPHKNVKPSEGNGELSMLKVGDIVRIYEGKSWCRLGTVVRKHKNPRSYIVKTDRGTTIRRNRRDLLKINNNSMIVGNDETYPDIDEKADVGVEYNLRNADAEVVNNNEEVVNNNEEVVNNDEENVVVTRSGRQVNRPSYLDAYETDRR